MAQKIGIIGRGNVGKALDGGLRRAGYETRMIGKDGGTRDTAAWADIVILAVPFSAVESVAGELAQAVNGKVVVDTSNALTKEGQLAVGFSTSGAEQLQRKLPAARVVKAFNMVFAMHMSTGKVKNTPLCLLAAGDDPAAREAVLLLARDIGFDAVDAGPLTNARWLEAFGYLNIQLGYVVNRGLGPNMGFALIR